MTARLIDVDGARVGVTAHGDARARRVVLLCHPTPGASDFDPDPLASAKSDARIIAAERAGYGSTDAAVADGGVPEAAELAALDEAVHAGAEVGGVVGWGYGGLIALRVAAARPDLVRRVAVVQAPRPSNKINGLIARRTRAWMLQQDDAQLGLAAVLGGTHIEALSVLGLGPADDALRRPGLGERLERMLSEAARGGLTGVALDHRAVRRGDWARVVGDVRARVLVIRGERDPRLSTVDDAWFRRHLRQVEVEPVITGGALSIATDWPRILDFLKDE